MRSIINDKKGEDESGIIPTDLLVKTIVIIIFFIIITLIVVYIAKAILS